MWTEMWLKSGQRVLDSMADMAKDARRASVKVGVIPAADAPRRRGRAKGGSRTKRGRR
jgi:hypothetical protein